MVGAIAFYEDRQLAKSDNEAQREELNRQSQELGKRLSIAPSGQHDDILREMNEIERELQEIALDDRLRSNMEGGSEA